MAKEGKKIAELWQKYIIIYNKNGEVTKTVNTINEGVSLFLEEISELLYTDESSYIKINCDNYNWNIICKFFCYEYGTILPKTSGIWRYDWEWGQWKSFEEEYKDLKNKWAPMGIFF